MSFLPHSCSWCLPQHSLHDSCMHEPVCGPMPTRWPSFRDVTFDLRMKCCVTPVCTKERDDELRWGEGTEWGEGGERKGRGERGERGHETERGQRVDRE